MKQGQGWFFDKLTKQIKREGTSIIRKKWKELQIQQLKTDY